MILREVWGARVRRRHARAAHLRQPAPRQARRRPRRAALHPHRPRRRLPLSSRTRSGSLTIPYRRRRTRHAVLDAVETLHLPAWTGRYSRRTYRRRHRPRHVGAAIESRRRRGSALSWPRPRAADGGCVWITVRLRAVVRWRGRYSALPRPASRSGSRSREAAHGVRAARETSLAFPDDSLTRGGRLADACLIAGGARLRCMKILLVEDEAPLADVLARNLRARGHDADAWRPRRGGGARAHRRESWPDVAAARREPARPDGMGRAAAPERRADRRASA